MKKNPKNNNFKLIKDVLKIIFLGGGGLFLSFHLQAPLNIIALIAGIAAIVVRSLLLMQSDENKEPTVIPYDSDNENNQ